MFQKNLSIKAFFLFIFLAASFQAAQPSSSPDRKTICLNMIVKNEVEVIERCLNSVMHLIDYWVIFDTGSTDGTQEIIQRVLQEIPGELHESPWVDFAHNRNEAMAAAKGKADYLLFIDADERLIFSENFSMPELSLDSYKFTVRTPDSVDGMRTGLVNSKLDWKWEGVVHEMIQCPEAKSGTRLSDMMILCDSKRGARSKDANTYLKDVFVLEKALEKDPNNSRNVFYLAQSYENARCDESALESYKKRIAMKSPDVQETYHAIYRVGVLQEKRRDYEAALKTFSQAYQFRPIRAEPLFHIAKIYRKMDQPLIGYFVLKSALSIPYPVSEACIERSIYEYALLIEFANCTLLLGKYREGLQACKKLLASPHLPEEFRDQITSNAKLARKSLVGYDANEVLELASQFLPKNPIILEAGAHYGEDTARLATFWEEGVVYAFEPNPQAFSKLKASSQNRSNVHCYPYALSEKEGVATFFVNQTGGNDGASSLLEAAEWMRNYYREEAIQVPCITLEAWQSTYEIPRVDFIWLDLEGMELPVLKRGTKLLADCRVIFVEVNHQEFRKGMSQYKELKAFLEQEGFSEFRYWAVPQIEQGNALFVRLEAQ